VQRLLLLTSYHLQLTVFALALAATAAAVRAQARMHPTLGRNDQRRMGVVWTAVIFGIGLPIATGSTQLTWLVVFHKQLVPSAVMMSLFATLLVVPPAVAYAARARRVESMRLLVRRAALFAFAQRTIQFFSFAPALVLLVLLYRSRYQSLVQLLAQRPIAVTLLVAMTLAALRYSSAIHSFIEGLFFRDRANAHRALAALAVSTRRIDRIDHLSQLLEREIDQALHLESAALFTRDPSGHFRARGVPWPIDAESTIVQAMANVADCLDVELSDAMSPLARAGEIERLWLEESRVQMLVPCRGGDGALVALMALGEKRSDLPFDRDDRALLGDIAHAAALVIENALLRTSLPGSARIGIGAEKQDDTPDAFYCTSCFAVAEDTARICPRDGAALVPAGIPALVSGKYRLESYVGAGGMGVVYRARDLALGRSVAIKTLPELSAEAAVRFRREARLGAAVAHPALAVVFAAEMCHGRPLLVMEYLSLGTLAKRIEQGPLPEQAVIDCAVRIGGALAVLHEAGVLHRDVKPSNIGFANESDAKLLDFGLARIVADSTVAAASRDAVDVLRSSATTGLIGTPLYLPPETILGSGSGVAADLWGLAMSLYEALIGVHPFRDSDHVRAMNRIVSEDVQSARAASPELAEALNIALARDPQRRFPDARAFTRAFRTLVH
jgi:GAF domain-containing protein